MESNNSQWSLSKSDKSKKKKEKDETKLPMKPAPEDSNNRKTYKKNLAKTTTEVLDDIKSRLMAAKEQLEKASLNNQNQEASKAEDDLVKLGGAGTPGSVQTTGGPSIGSQIGFPGMGKKEDEDKKDAEKIAEEKIKEHEKEKHSAKGHAKEHEKIKFGENGQWDIEKMEDDAKDPTVNSTPVNE